MQVEQQLQHQWLSVCHSNDIPYIPNQSGIYHAADHLQCALVDCANILHRILDLNGSQVDKNQGDKCLQVSLFQKRFLTVQVLLRHVSQDLTDLYDDLKLHGRYLASTLFQEVAIATIDDEYQHVSCAMLESIYSAVHSAFFQLWRVNRCDL